MLLRILKECDNLPTLIGGGGGQGRGGGTGITEGKDVVISKLLKESCNCNFDSFLSATILSGIHTKTLGCALLQSPPYWANQWRSSYPSTRKSV